MSLEELDKELPLEEPLFSLLEHLKMEPL